MPGTARWYERGGMKRDRSKRKKKAACWVLSKYFFVLASKKKSCHVPILQLLGCYHIPQHRKYFKRKANGIWTLYKGSLQDPMFKAYLCSC